LSPIYTILLKMVYRPAIVQDTCRTGVWLGWHICYNATQVSQGQLRENRNLSSSIRAKAVLIYVLPVPAHNDKYLYLYYCFRNKAVHFYSSSVKARPSDPLDYVWILWCFCISYSELAYILIFKCLSQGMRNISISLLLIRYY